MNTKPNRLLPPSRLRLTFTLACGLMIVGLPARAQLAPTPASDPAALARYDKNKNGRLDADELAAMEADRRKSVPVETAASATGTSDEIVTLSPFEVVTDNKGYLSANHPGRTRFATTAC